MEVANNLFECVEEKGHPRIQVANFHFHEESNECSRVASSHIVRMFPIKRRAMAHSHSQCKPELFGITTLWIHVPSEKVIGDYYVQCRFFLGPVVPSEEVAVDHSGFLGILYCFELMITSSEVQPRL